MDIRNWMSGSTKRAKSAPSQEKVGPTSQGPVRNKEEEDAIIDSDEDIKPQRKKQKTTLPQVFELPVNRSDEGLPSPCTFSAQAQSGKQVIVLDEVKEKRSPQKLAKKSSIENFTPVKRKCFDDMKIAVTGVPVAMSREDMEEFILSNGGKVVGSVSGKTNLLVTGSQLEDGRSVNEGMKYRAAIEKNVTIMTEEEFFAKYNSEVVRLEQQQQSAKAQITKSSMSIASSSSSGVRLEDTSLWVDKYRPRVAEDLIGHGETVRKLMDWLKSWNDVHLLKKFKPAFTKENPGARAVLLSGPPGIGKTSLSALVASLLSYDVLELNASDTRNKAEIDQILIEAVSSKAISQSAFFTSSTPLSLSRTAKNRVVIMDEVDGMGGSDRGGISELIKIIKISKIPIICICNDRQSQKVKGLANSCYDLRVKRPTKAQIAQRLIRVAAQEGLQVDVNAAEMLVEQSGNDIRQALNALQMWAISGHREMSFQDMKEGMHRIEKDKVLRQSPFDACLTILSGGKQGSFEERYNSFFIDYSLVPLLIQQNYIDSSKSGIFRNPQIDDTQKMEHLSLAADAVSDLDLVGSRIRGLDQHWELLPTQSVLSVKVGWHVQGFQAFPTFPAWLGKYSTTTKKHRLTKEIVHHTCLSIGQGFLPIRLDYIPFLRSALLNPLLKAGKDGAIKTIEMLDCYDLSKEDFSESLREMQFKLENDKILTDQYEQLDTQTKTALTRLYNSMSHKSATIAQSIGTKRAKRFAVAPLNDDFVDEDGEIILDANDGPEEEEEEEDIEALRSEMNKSLNKAKVKKATTEKKAESNARKSNKKK